MSEEMAVGDNASSEEPITDSNGSARGSIVASMENVKATPSDQKNDPQKESKEETLTELEVQVFIDQDVEDSDGENDEDDNKRGMKRRASLAFSDDLDTEFKGFDHIEDSHISEAYARIVAEEDWKFPRRPSVDEDFKGFDDFEVKPIPDHYNHVIGRLENEISEAVKSYTPIRSVKAGMLPPTAGKQVRQDTDSSRPSSALSSRSDGDAAHLTDASSSPLGSGRGRRPTTEMSSPLLRVPLDRGWKRELVYRAALDPHSRRNADIYYYTPSGKKLRSSREVAEHLSGTGLSIENFSFFKEPLGIDDPEREIIRDAKVIRRGESPVQSPTPPQPESKRTPKPKPVPPPKELVTQPAPAEPESVKSPPLKIKVKSMGSRLNNNATPPAPKQQRRQSAQQTPQQQTQTQQQQPTTPAADNNNSAAWKKQSEKVGRGRVANGAVSNHSALASPRRGGRAKNDEADTFAAFYKRAQEKEYNVAVQIFQYMGMRDLSRCARVCKLWRQLTSTPQLWRHVRMKNSHVNDWGGLCAALKKHGTKWLDLRKMLLPTDDAAFWDQFIEKIASVDVLER
ncbi:unnamed protein product [Leptidea sinapis]|uniref:MBD domain-containing protein n=1 Tax=Leptidea sinapis TaxID=189913 RepID=A0A5E4Q1H0_9NEOP|nr:unnamed protein product [Leptidea sinapis]